MRYIVSTIITLLVLTFSFTTFGQAASEDYYSVVLKNNAKAEAFKGDLSLTDAEIVYEVPEIGYYQVKASKGDLKEIKGFKSVSLANESFSWDVTETERIELSEEEASNIINDANTEEAGFWPIQWDIQRITENGASYDISTGSHDTSVAVIDTGINPTHIDLAPNLLDGSKNFVPAGGFRGTEPNETGDPGNFVDLHGHGSHVSGSIAGAGNGMLGVAPDLGLRAYRVFGTSSAESGWIYNAMISAADDGNDVLSMSLGGMDLLGQVFVRNPETGKMENAGNDVADYVAYKRAVQYVNDKGAIIVTSAGNDALDITKKNQVTQFMNDNYGTEDIEFRGSGEVVPANLSGVINVSATGPEDILSIYSNYGAGAIDLATVGGDTRLYTQYASEGRLDEYLANRMHYWEFNLSADNRSDDGYYFSVGTSMATPKVSAVVGMIIDQHDGELSPAQVKHQLLKNGVEGVAGEEKKYFGAGHLNAVNALQ
ncbi:peptidase S8 [Halalkalibacillus sediminis]|uniref:Peptidase S8 n=1 Tax=Halalkalibacillus sediminis TaxID=2018042 RepID=A0A2I0QUE7_9BACI|nr:S8 family serine peptidase [Halalkalibacillus sediminis]PKR77971.1 peptidase S8 [Halalkalibacillus sediminis]